MLGSVAFEGLSWFEVEVGVGVGSWIGTGSWSVNLVCFVEVGVDKGVLRRVALRDGWRLRLRRELELDWNLDSARGFEARHIQRSLSGVGLRGWGC